VYSAPRPSSGWLYDGGVGKGVQQHKHKRWGGFSFFHLALAGGEGIAQVTAIGEALQANVKDERLPVPFVEDCGALGNNGVSDAALVALYESRKSANAATLAAAVARRDETPQQMANRCDPETHVDRVTSLPSTCPCPQAIHPPRQCFSWVRCVVAQVEGGVGQAQGLDPRGAAGGFE